GRDPDRGADASRLRARRLLRLPPDGGAVPVVPALAARRPRSPLDPATRLRRAPARRPAGRAPAQVTARDGERARRRRRRLRTLLRAVPARTARPARRPPRPAAHPEASDPPGAVRAPRPPAGGKIV